LQHPASLNVLQQFRQASALFKRTSRAGNADWYAQALELDYQLHIRIDGASVASFYHDKSQDRWFDGPLLTESQINDPAAIGTCAAAILAHARSIGATSLGIVLHLADEFSIAELKPDFEDSGLLEELRDAAVTDPATILDDSSVSTETGSWRVIPYTASDNGAIGTAVTVTRAHADFLEALRLLGEEENFPIITHAMSAPLVALMGIPQAVALAPDRAFVAILQYPPFTVLGFFNSRAELLLIRTQQHRGQRRQPNLQRAISTTNASLELDDPDLFVFALGHDVDKGLLDDLKIAFAGCRVEQASPPVLEGLPAWCPEPGISLAGDVPGDSRTFAMLRGEGWSLQNFLPPPPEHLQLFPSRAEMRLLSLCRLGRVPVVAITLCVLAWAAMEVLEIIRKPEWTFDINTAATTQARLTRLHGERAEIDHLDNLLADRSKAWSSMELLAQLIPEDLGLRVRDFSHTVRPDSAPGQAKVGYVKEWKIAGLARREGVDYLQSLNTRDGISEKFEMIARLTGDTSYDPNLGNRTLVPNIRTQENSSFRQRPAEEISDLDDTTYPLSFDLTITQRFESTDPLALNVAKPAAAPVQ